MWHFTVDGDIHATYTSKDVPRVNRTNIDTRLKHIDGTYPLDFHLCVGDLTDNGHSGPTMCGMQQRYDELVAFEELYERPVQWAGFRMYATIGNHDVPNDQLCKGVINHVAKKYGASRSLLDPWSSGCYAFDHKGVRFIVLGIWPQKLDWLRRQLPVDHSAPVVLVHHYNINPMEYGANFWTDEAKDAYHAVIKSHNVVLICTGHNHTTTIGLWRNIPTVRGSGNKLAVVEMDGGRLSRIYFDNGETATVSTIDRLSAFQKWRALGSKDVARYDAYNGNAAA